MRNMGGDEWFLEDDVNEDRFFNDDVFWFDTIMAAHETAQGEREGEALFCRKHQEGPLDVWYDCDKCVQEVGDGPAPPASRYVCTTL